MNLHNVSLTISAVRKAQYPETQMPELAFAGRSNVGKSSFINKMLNRKKLARTSGKPGKTATLNFYNIDGCLFFVDLPGYGYAEVSRAEKEKWDKMITEYLNTRQQLVQTVLVVDARHKPSVQDQSMFGWIKNRHGRAVVVATKADKLKKTRLEESLGVIYETFAMTDSDILIPFSAETGLGTDDAWNIFRHICGISDED